MERGGIIRGNGFCAIFTSFYHILYLSYMVQVVWIMRCWSMVCPATGIFVALSLSLSLSLLMWHQPPTRRCVITGVTRGTHWHNDDEKHRVCVYVELTVI